MFEATFDRLEKLQAIFQALEPFGDVLLRVHEDGVSCQILNEGKNNMIAMSLTKGIFDHFRLDHAGTLPLGLSIPCLLKVLKKCSSDRSVTMRWTEERSNLLAVVIAAADPTVLSGADATFEVDVPLITVDNESDLEIPERLYDVDLDVTTTLLASDLDRFGSIGAENVAFEITGSNLIMHANAGDANNGMQLRSCYTNGGDIQWAWNSASGIDCIHANFSYRSIKDFVSAKNLSVVIKLELSQSAPLCLKYNLGCDAYVSYYIAPRDA